MGRREFSLAPLFIYLTISNMRIKILELIMLISACVSYWASGYDNYCLATVVLALAIVLLDWSGN